MVVDVVKNLKSRNDNVIITHRQLFIKAGRHRTIVANIRSVVDKCSTYLAKYLNLKIVSLKVPLNSLL